MQVDKVFAEQRRRNEAAGAVNHGVTFLCFETKRSTLALPLVEAREVVERPVIVSYPTHAAPHVGIANVRGTVVPVLALDGDDGQREHLVVLDSGTDRLFSLLVGAVRTATVRDAALAEAVNAPSALTGVARVSGTPLRWVTTRWLLESLMGSAET